MDLAHLHVMITHLPIFGTLIGALVLINGLYTKNNQTQMAAYYIFILSAIGVLISNYTGEFAEETAEKIQGVVKSNIHEHEEAAEFAVIFVNILGFLSIIGALIAKKKFKWNKNYGIMILILSLFCLSVLFRTGYLGGQIRHTEFNSSSMKSGVIK